MKSLAVLCILPQLFFAVYGQAICKCPSLTVNRCFPENKETWSYEGWNGPMNWGITANPQCNGSQQSPININTTTVQKDENLDKLTLSNYNQPIIKANIVNNGHTIQITPEDGVERTIFVNEDEYRLAQFHFHWGCNKSRGSEHTIDGTEYAMEMHHVHTNGNGGIAVVGILIQEDGPYNEEFQKIVDQLKNVKYKGDTNNFNSDIDLDKLLPANPTSYYRYQGSLTTPPCTEGVTWSVVPNPISVGSDQMEQFRQLYSVEEKKLFWQPNEMFCNLVDNYRPTQPNNSPVFLSQ